MYVMIGIIDDDDDVDGLCHTQCIRCLAGEVWWKPQHFVHSAPKIFHYCVTFHQHHHSTRVCHPHKYKQNTEQCHTREIGAKIAYHAVCCSVHLQRTHLFSIWIKRCVKWLLFHVGINSFLFFSSLWLLWCSTVEFLFLCWLKSLPAACICIFIFEFPEQERSSHASAWQTMCAVLFTILRLIISFVLGWRRRTVPICINVVIPTIHNGKRNPRHPRSTNMYSCSISHLQFDCTYSRSKI